MWKTMTSKDTNILEWYGGLGKKCYKSPFNITAKQFVRSNKNVEKLAKTFCSCYLRPQKYVEAGRRRGKIARKWYNSKNISLIK